MRRDPVTDTATPPRPAVTDVAYYPGCSLHGTSREFDESLRAVAAELGIGLAEIADWSCCGASSGHTTDHLLGVALPARNLALAEAQGFDTVLAPCAACYNRLSAARLAIATEDGLAEQMRDILGRPFANSVEVHNAVELLRDASPTIAPTKKARVTPTAASQEATAAAIAVPTAPKASAQEPADLTVTVRRFLKLNVSPSQARVYLDERPIGIGDDWDDGGGGSLLAFNLEGTHRLRICAPGYHDLLVDLMVQSTATDDKVTIDRRLEKGTPDGPTGPAWLPEGKLKHPNYRTTRDAVFNVEPPEALVSVNGRVLGPASKKDFQFAEMAVYEVLLTAPGYVSKSLRILVGPAAGEVRANIKEKLKKM